MFASTGHCRSATLFTTDINGFNAGRSPIKNTLGTTEKTLSLLAPPGWNALFLVQTMSGTVG